jgi:hypothetical protein
MKTAASLWVALVFTSLSISAQNSRIPVLVELFTSEGCSSCPPADALLIQLDKNQPVPGAEVIILSQHVDYWNQLGWKDPFSSAEFSRRQQAYTESMEGNGPYTPQMIVDGRTEFNGSNGRKAQQAIADAARNPKATVKLTLSPDREGSPHVQIYINGLDAAGVFGMSSGKASGKADVLLAITESGLQSSVTRGENAGRTMPHSGVVRRLSSVGTATKAGFSADQVISLDKSWKRENLRLVVFVQERGSRRVLGAASAGL